MTHRTDGMWGREIRAQAARERQGKIVSEDKDKAPERTIDRLHRETGISMRALETAFQLSTNGMLDEETMAGLEVIPSAAKVIDSALATVRREVWNETFKIQCVDCAEGDEPIYSKEARWFYHGISNQEVGCSASKLRIAALERAAESGEGENDESAKE